MIVGQLFGVPRALYIVGITISVLGVITPLQTVVFVGLGMMFIIIGRTVQGSLEMANIEHEVDTEEASAEEIRQPENVNSLLQVDPVELEFGYGIIPLADVNQGGDLLDRVVMIRRQIALEMGTVVPIIRLRDNIQLNPNQYIIKIKGIQFIDMLPDHLRQMGRDNGRRVHRLRALPTPMV